MYKFYKSLIMFFAVLIFSSAVMEFKMTNVVLQDFNTNMSMFNSQIEVFNSKIDGAKNSLDNASTSVNQLVVSLNQSQSMYYPAIKVFNDELGKINKSVPIVINEVQNVREQIPSMIYSLTELAKDVDGISKSFSSGVIQGFFDGVLSLPNVVVDKAVSIPKSIVNSKEIEKNKSSELADGRTEKVSVESELKD